MCAKLKSLSLENFRVFEKMTDFKFEKINIITGPNNSGKSSLIKALLLLQDNYIDGWSILNFDKGNHNLISYEHTVNNQSNQDYIRINFTVDNSDFSNNNADDILGAELIFKKIDEFVLLTEAKFLNAEGNKVTTAKLIGQGEDIFKYYLSPNWFVDNCPLSEDEISKLADTNVSFSRTRLTRITTPHTLSDIISRSNYFITHLISNRKAPFTDLFDSKDLSEKIKFTFSDLSIEEVLNLDLLRNFDHKPAIYFFFHKYNLKYEPAVRNQQLTVYPFDHNFSQSLSGLMAIKSHYDNNSEEIRFINRWIGKHGFDIMQEIDGIKIEKIPGAGYHFSFLRNSKTFDLTNLGSGAAQILPILIQIVISSKESTILLEEPETNLHPNFQSKLAELFMEASGDPFGHQFIIETHSEYLIRKLQYLVATKKIKSGEIQVYYFNLSSRTKANGIGQVMSIDIFDNGGLSQNFGEGFFDEASTLRFGLLEINNAQKN